MPDAVIQPLEVFILDADFKRLTGSIPYDSLVWHRRYYGVGEFEMQVRSSLYSTDWAYVYCDDRPETGIIQKVEYDDTTEGPRNGEDTVIVSGFFLEEILNRLVFLVEEYETQEIKHVVPKPTRLSVSKPQFKVDADGNYYSIWKNGTINNLMTGEAARVEDSQDLIAGLTDADVGLGKGMYEQKFSSDQGSYTVGLYSTNFSYVSDDGKLNVLTSSDKQVASYDIVGDPSAGLILYKDEDGSVKWVNGAVESYGDTYHRKRQRWESLQVDEDGNHYWMEYRDVEGPWMLRADLDDVKSPQDNVQWILKMAEKTFEGNFIYDKVTFEGETKTLAPSLSRMGDFFYGELQSVEASLRVLYHFESDQMVFQLWRGLDRTQDGGGQTPVEPAALMAASAEPDVPIGYEKLEYIQGTGTQYVNTGFRPDNDTRVVVDITSPTNRSNSPQPFGATDGTRYFVIYIGPLGMWNTRFGTSAITTIEGSDGAGDRVTIDKNKNVTSVNEYSLTLPDQTFSIDRPLYLLARNNNGTADSFCNGSIYSCQIYDDGTLMRDFVPVKRYSDGAVGLYDTVTDTFFGNSGTGIFTAGPVVSIADSLTYDPNGGEGTMDPTPGYVGDAVVVEANEFTRDGHTFRVWNTQADGGGADYAPLSEYTLTSGTDVLFAQWDEVVEPPVPVPEGVGVPWAVFSDTWGTLYGFKASHDTSNYRNLAYVLYDYEEPVWDENGNVAVEKVPEFGEIEPGLMPIPTGYHYEVSAITRRGFTTVRVEDDRPDSEVWIDRRGDSPDFMQGFEAGEVDEGTTYSFTKADFDAWVKSLKTDAEKTLRNDYCDVDNLNTGTITTMRYLYDYDLGDKVDMAVEAIGMAKTARITEVEEVYESGSAEIHLTMGEELLTTDKKSLLV